MAEKIKVDRDDALTERPEEIIYRTAYAPVSLKAMLESAETRGRIRRLPLPHLFFGLKELNDEEVLRMLPHLTEEQWTGVLDLDLWTRDRASTGKFLYWEKHITEAQDAVARKVVRAADPDLWELTFKRETKVYAKADDDYEDEPEGSGEWLETPDQHFLIELPQNQEKAGLLRALILRLYELDPAYAALLLDSSRARTSSEIEETAYGNRKRRVEEMGFQDYFDALDIYTYLSAGERLAEKQFRQIREVSTLPVSLEGPTKESLLLFQAMARIRRPQEIQYVFEELFYVCNKVLSADCTSAGDLKNVRRGIRKAITGMNVGLDWWSEGKIQKAIQGIRHHYLQSFFQLGYSRLVDLQRVARGLKEEEYEPEPGSFLEAAVESLLRRYPLFVEERAGRIRKRFFRTGADLDKAREYLGVTD